LKVAFLTGSVSRAAGGFFESVRALARALQNLEALEIAVFGLLDEFSAQDLENWRPTDVRTFPVLGPRAFGFTPKLRKALAEYRADLVHLHGIWMYPSLLAMGWGRATGRPVVISPRGMLDPWAMRNSQWRKQAAAFLFENANLRRASCLHALSGSESIAIRGYGLTNPVCTVPNGVGMNVSVVDSPPWTAVVPPGCKVLLYLGRLHPKKNLINLVEAWAALKRGGVREADCWHLVIIGWDQAGYERLVRNVVEREGLHDVHLIGPRFGREKDAALTHAAALVLPSLSEGLPMTVLEAWAHGIPVLMTPACNLREGFDAGAAAEIGAEPASIAAGIQRLVNLSEDERRGMGRCGRELVQRRFTWESVARQMHEVYQWVLERGALPGCVSASSTSGALGSWQTP
jgi:glycosyltransferase involved in cell wall biosynthesis